MELDELKNTWMVLDERLTKQEILNESIIREMNDKKTNKSLNHLLWSDGIGIPLLLLLIPFIVYAYEKFGGKHIFWDITVIFAGVFCIAYLPFLIYRVYGLMKIDLSGNFKDNLYYINRYVIQIKREKIMIIIIGPVSFILVCLTFFEAKADAFRWTLWICISILITLYGFWSYSKFYNKNIQSIKNSLEELQELKEE